jgi:dihydrofolate reductase
MRKLVVSEFVTLDGVMEDPGGAEGTPFGGWAFKVERGPDGDRYKLDELMAADILLLGRRTYEGVAAAWPSMGDEEGFADKMNSMRKAVVSSTLTNPTWANTQVIALEDVEDLRAEDGGDLLVAGSASLVAALLEHDLVDELRLMSFPVVAGTGRRLFDGPVPQVPWELVEARQTGGVSVQTLRRSR